MPDPINITVDGRTVQAEPGELLIAAAERAGIYIPRFCWHPRMDPVGACRMCLVHVEGSRTIPGASYPQPQTACTTQVRDGMEVQTQFTNEVIEAGQRGMLEFLLINHPLDCPICDRGGECPLQDQTLDYGPAESRFIEPKRRFRKPVAISPLINLDRERCILCYRCTRFCDELSGDTMISAVQRGARAYIWPFPGEQFDSYFSGNTVQICPVGALTSREYRFEARPWDLRVTPTTCNLCASGCAMTADVRVADGRFVRVTAAVDEQVNEEWLCDRGRYGHAYVSSPERIEQPRIQKDGYLVPVSWDEAFRVLAERLKPALASRSAAVIVGGSLPDEDSYVAAKFARVVLGTNSVDHRLAGGMSADTLVPPQLSYDDLLGAELAVLVGLDAREELPLVFLRLRVAARKKSLAIALVHPRSVSLRDQAAVHVAPLPGCEAHVGAAVAGDASHLSTAGLSPGDVEGLKELIAGSQRTVFLLGPDMAADPDAVRAWAAAAQVCGARLGWAPRRAGEYGALAAGAHPELLPGWRRLDDESGRSQVEQVWGSPVPSETGEDVAAILRRAATGGADALWVVAADLVRDVPQPIIGSAALSNAKFTVVSDVELSPTALHADLVLPAAAFAERAGTLTGWEGRRRTLNVALEPPGAARADYAILAEAARRLGKPIGCRTLGTVQAELSALLRPGGSVQARQGPDLKSREALSGYPLILQTYRLLYDDGSRVRHTQGIRELTPAAFVQINPSDAQAAGISDGAPVKVVSEHGAIVASAKVSAGIRAGAVFVPYLQPGVSAQDLLTLDERYPAVRVESA